MLASDTAGNELLSFFPSLKACIYIQCKCRETGKDQGGNSRPLKDQQSTGSPSHVVYREVWGVALTGVLTGQPLSHEMYIKFPAPTLYRLREGNIIGCGAIRVPYGSGGLETPHVITILRGNRETPLTICQCRRWPAPGRRGAEAGDVRRGEVGPAHSAANLRNKSARAESVEREAGAGPWETRNSYTCAGRRAGACHRGCHAEAGEAAEERTVYRIVPPPDSRGTGERIPS